MLHFAIAADNETIVFVLISLVILYNLQTIDAKMKKIFILLIFHHLAMAQIDQHFTVDQSDYFRIWEGIKDYNWISANKSCQNYQEIFSEDGEDPNEMCCKHLQLLKETANSGSFLLPNKNWALKSRLDVDAAVMSRL